ncbi:MAG: lamin tail domain-containing protein [Candidatus Tectomicrobia bacterium]|nr:lamin tail domain-containing protein [Candidatus Tectomicrobia bacterium]
MAYTLITGTFYVLGLQPDGDTIRFAPDRPELVDSLEPPGQEPAWRNDRTRVNIRFEAIDALETHFSGTHQNQPFGEAATQQMLSRVGFTSVTFSGASVSAAEPNTVRGFILAQGLDSFGRVIAFVYSGEPDEADGNTVFIDNARLAASVNSQVLNDGLVYPAFYSSLPVNLKDQLAAQTRVARQAGAGLWPHAQGQIGSPVAIPDLPTLETLILWPKLFRRLVRYFQDGNPDLAGFDAWLRDDQHDRDDFIQLPDGEIGNMHNTFKVSENELQMVFAPEGLVILPDTFVPRPMTTADLRIVAALVNPVGADRGHENVTIINTSPDPADLTGWLIRDRQGGRHPLSGQLAAGECTRVELGNTVRLANTGDDIELVNPQGESVHRVSYNEAQGEREGHTIVF